MKVPIYFYDNKILSTKKFVHNISLPSNTASLTLSLDNNLREKRKERKEKEGKGKEREEKRKGRNLFV